MTKVQKVAVFCTARVVFIFSTLIYVVMVFFWADPAFAFRVGAILTVIMSGALAWKAGFVTREEPSESEVWRYLDDGTRQQCRRDRQVFSDTMRKVYGSFGQHTLAIACIMFAISTGLVSLDQPATKEILHASVN
jgi:hypothetical protein